MKREKITVKRNGKSYSGEIVWPQDLAQAISLLGELEVWGAFRVGYRELAKRRISGLTPRQKRWARVDLSSLDDQMRVLIQALVHEQQNKPLPQEVSQPPQPSAESPQPVAQQIAPSDSGETQEEALTLSPDNGDSFEQDFAKYLASLDSSPQSHTAELA